MMPSLTGPYRIDRPGPVRLFYVHRAECRDHASLPANAVFALSGRHDTPGWMTVGFVSRQSPFGQGGAMGFKRGDLRPATPAEVKAALRRNHPQGPTFRPNCTEFTDAKMNFDTQRNQVDPAAAKRLGDAIVTARTRCLGVLEQWPQITKRQIAAVLAQLG